MKFASPIARRNMVTVAHPIPSPVYQFMARAPSFNKYTQDQEAVFEATRANLDLWKEMFPNIPIMDADGTIARHSIELKPVVEYKRKLVPSVTPFAHQKWALDVCMSRNIFAFFFDIGTGKSHIIANAAAELWAASKIDKALIITQKRVMEQFRDEQLPLHMPLSPRDSYYSSCLYWVAYLFPSKIADKIFPIREREGNLLIAIVSPGAFQSSSQVAKISKFCKGGKTAVFIDESQNFKSWSALRTKNLLSLVDFIPYRYLLSGEPSPLGYIDLFSQFFFLSPDIIGHSGITSFKAQYCQIESEYHAIIGYKNQVELTNRIGPHCRFLSITDCQDMPEKQYIEARFTPSIEQRELYQNLKNNFYIEVRQALKEPCMGIKSRLCESAGSKLRTMRQVAAGWFYADPEDNNKEESKRGEVVVVNDERALQMVEAHVLTAKKCIVWGAHHADLDSIRRALDEFGIQGLEISGRVTSGESQENKRRFIEQESVRVLYGTCATGGIGLDGLQLCNREVFHTNTYNYGHRHQAEGRIWRTGQKNICQYIDMTGFGIDRMLLDNLRKKRDISTELRNLVFLAGLEL